MTTRQKQIVKSILEELNALEGAQMSEQLLHAGVSLRVTPTASLGEFSDALRLCDTSGWITGVPSRYGGKLWNLSDAGQAARLEIK